MSFFKSATTAPQFTARHVVVEKLYARYQTDSTRCRTARTQRVAARLRGPRPCTEDE